MNRPQIMVLENTNTRTRKEIQQYLREFQAEQDRLKKSKAEKLKQLEAEHSHLYADNVRRVRKLILEGLRDPAQFFTLPETEAAKLDKTPALYTQQAIDDYRKEVKENYKKYKAYEVMEGGNRICWTEETEILLTAFFQSNTDLAGTLRNLTYAFEFLLGNGYLEYNEKSTLPKPQPVEEPEPLKPVAAPEPEMMTKGQKAFAPMRGSSSPLDPDDALTSEEYRKKYGIRHYRGWFQDRNL